jgi:hypothetical protein
MLLGVGARGTVVGVKPSRPLIVLALAVTLAACSGDKPKATSSPAPIGSRTSSGQPSPAESAAPGALPSTGAPTTGGGTTPTKGPSPQPVQTASPAVPPAAGTYTYDQSGGTSAGSFSIPVDDTGTLQIYAATKSGSDYRQRQVRRYSDKESGDQRLLFTDKGIYIESSNATVYGMSQECETDEPLLGVRLPLKVGTTWSDSGTCSGVTIKLTGKVLRTERYTVGGTSLNTFVVRVTAKGTSDQGSQTTTETMWISPDYRLTVHSVSDATGEAQGYTFERHVTESLRSLTPS